MAALLHPDTAFASLPHRTAAQAQHPLVTETIRDIRPCWATSLSILALFLWQEAPFSGFPRCWDWLGSAQAAYLEVRTSELLH